MMLLPHIFIAAGFNVTDRPFGPDVSHYQSVIDWASVKAAGASFAFAKASEGLNTGDDQFAHNWAGIKKAGIPIRGAYHFGHPEEDATNQANHFLSQINGLGAGDLLVLDIEVDGGKSPSAVAEWCHTFLKAVMAKSGLPASRVLVYTGAWFWNPKAGGASMGSHPLWVSGYTTSPPIPNGWSDWTYWQYTDKASKCVPGKAVDCSVYHGTLEELHTAAGLI